MEKKQKLRMWILLGLIAVAGMLAQRQLGGGDISHVKRIIGESWLYTQAEIQEMMDLVEQTFRREFRGCTLTELKYDEDYSKKQSGDWDGETVVLTSSFDVDSSGGDGSLQPNSSYTRWMWVLSREEGGSWYLRTWGY